MGSNNEHDLVWDVKSSETLIQPTRGNGEHMGGESVYQIQVSWKSIEGAFKFLGCKLEVISSVVTKPIYIVEHISLSTDAK